MDEWPPLVDELHARGELPWLVALLCAAGRHRKMKGSHRVG